MNIKNRLYVFLFSVSTLFTLSCEKSLQEPLKLDGLANTSYSNPAEGPWVIWGGKDSYMNWEGGIKTISGTIPSTLTFSQTEKTLPYAIGGNTFGDYLFKLSSDDMYRRGIQRYNIGSSVSPYGFINLSFNYFDFPSFQPFEANYYIYSSTVGYYWRDRDNGLTLYEFNPSTMTLTSTIDMRGFFNTASVPGSITSKDIIRVAGAKMIIRRGNKIFVDVLFGTKLNSLRQVEQTTENVYVGVIDATTKKVERVSYYEQAKNIGLFNDHQLANVDQVTGHLYFVAVSDFTDVKKRFPSKILRIKNGETSIDKNWEIDISNDNYRLGGDFNSMFAHNDIIYTKIPNTKVQYSGNTEGHVGPYRSGVWEWSAIKVTASGGSDDKKLDIPRDNFYCYQQPVLINGEIYFIYNNTEQTIAGNGDVSGINKISPLTPSTFDSSPSIIPTTKVTTLNRSNGYIRIMGLNKKKNI